MKHHIDPTNDCVFKAILGNPKHKEVLIHFLNSITHPEIPITEVAILNPYNQKEFETDKLTVVDVKARDSNNQTYQIEIQLKLTPSLPSRILYTWSDLYQAQIQSGENFNELQPVISIWLLTSTLLHPSSAFHHHFEVWDHSHKVRLVDHCSIHLLELPKWKKRKSTLLKDEDLWLYFFEEAKYWDDLPSELQTIPEMRKAMAVLKMFSEKEKNYHLYQARQNAIREEREREQMFRKQEQQMRDQEQQMRNQEQQMRNQEQQMRNQEQQMREKAQLMKATAQRLQEALQREEEERKQKEKLMALLKQAGLDPDKDIQS